MGLDQVQTLNAMISSEPITAEILQFVQEGEWYQTVQLWRQ